MAHETNSLPYTKAKVLMLCWDPNKKAPPKKTLVTFKNQRDSLGGELVGFNFGVQKFEIKSVKPYRALFQRLHKFLRANNRDTLLMVYYGGHGEKNKDN
jgi:hypothetical protein